ncbi:MAG: Small subunit (SSU) processome component [Vezdaea acicularis]|nr:MAG: Small subunit (SSU) processome component [Vezdaea acicularis]
MSKSRVDDSHAEVVARADTKDVRTSYNKPQVVEISSDSDEESEDDSDGEGVREEVADSQFSEELSGDEAADHDMEKEDKMELDRSSPRDDDIERAGSVALDDENLEEPTFGEILKANAAVPVDVEAAFSDDADDAAPVDTTHGTKALQSLQTPSATSLGTVLTQALRTNDTSLFDTCLNTTDVAIIRATIERLDSPLATALLQKLAERLHRRPGRAGSLMVWIQWTIVSHGGYLATQPKLVQNLASLQRVIKERASGLQPLLALKGKLDMLEAQMQLRKSMQASSRPTYIDEAEDPRVIYVEGEDDDDDSEPETTHHHEVTVNGDSVQQISPKGKAAIGIAGESDDESEDMPTTNGVTAEPNEESEDDEDDDDLIDDEAEDTEDDDSDELEEDSIDYEAEEEEEDGEDVESEIEMPPKKRPTTLKRKLGVY